jgi:serine/threonine-protein kinase
MFGEASAALTRRFGSYEVAGTIAEPRSSDGSTIFIAISRPPSPERDHSGKLALSFSPSKPNEATKTLSRPVIIKQIASSLTADRGKLEVFIGAAGSATTLRHPNVAELESIGTEGADVYLVEDYLLGETVASLLRRLQAEGDRLKPPLAAYISEQVCAALHAGHSLGLVHSRLTPHDILIGYDGTVHVLDIGIADARVKLADSRISGVELEYAAPEVCRNETVDARADIFSLGVILWELLSGLSPFERAQDDDVVRAICDESVVPPKNIVPGLPTELSVITLQALHRDRGMRFQSARAMAGALDSMVQKYIVGKPADHLAKVMKKLFAHRERDKREMVRRVMAGAPLTGLDYKATDRSTAPARRVAEPAPLARPAPPPPFHDGDPSDPTNVISMAPVKSRPPPPMVDDQPSVVIKAGPDSAPFVGTMVATLPSTELRLGTAPIAFPRSMPPRPDEADAAPAVLDDARWRPPPKRRVGGGAMVAIIGTIIAVTIVLVVVLGRNGEALLAKKPGTPAASLVAARESPPPPPPAPLPAPEPAPIPEPAPAPAPAPATAPVDSETTLHIETIPAQSAIFIAGTKRGVSPADIRVAKGSAPIVVEIRHSGYSTLREQIVPDQNQRLKLTLLAKGSKAAPAPAPSATNTNPYKKFE